jgi:hypothetical protein
MAQLGLVMIALAACGNSNPSDGSDAGPDATSGGPEVIVPRTGLTPDQVAVLVNDDDPLSISVAGYYVTARHIPPQNVIHLHVGSGARVFPSPASRRSRRRSTPR